MATIRPTPVMIPVNIVSYFRRDCAGIGPQAKKNLVGHAFPAPGWVLEAFIRVNRVCPVLVHV
jgi:hypothetical protein